MNKLLRSVIVIGATCWGAQVSAAETGMGLRAGTMGFGVDFEVGLTEKLNLRVGYNFFDYDQTIEDTDVTYEGTLKISSFSGVLDWHPSAGAFRISLGAVGSGPKIDLIGTPRGNNTYEIGNTTYTTAQIGSLTGEIKIGSSIAPYIGIGWGNVISEKHRLSFLVDIGAIYGGTPDISINAQCGATLTTTQCNTLQTQLQTDIAEEKRELEEDASGIKWYPVINIGLGIRF